MFNISFIPEFDAMRRDSDGNDRYVTPKEFEEFWGPDRMCSAGFKYEFSDDFAIRVHMHPVLVSPGSLFEICQYFNVKYPKDKMESILKEHTRFQQKWGAATKRREMEMPGYNRDVRLEESQICIKRMEKARDSLIPNIFRADNTKLETARLRAVWGALQWEIKMQRALVAGFTYPKLFE